MTIDPQTPDKVLFTTGPVATSPGVRSAMLRDLCWHNREFLAVVDDVRRRLRGLAGAGAEDYEAVLMAGSGTYAIESVIGSAVPRGGKLLVTINGACGRSMAAIASALGVETRRLEWPEQAPVDPAMIRQVLESDPSITHVGMVHCETSTGVLNPVEATGAVVDDLGRVFLVDAVSSFGGVALALGRAAVDFLISASGTCLEGAPGLGVILARRSRLEELAAPARGLSFDLAAQWRALDRESLFRFTPPTHVLLALGRALEELGDEGGVAGRAARYAANRRTLWAGMASLGFEPDLAQEHASDVVTCFRYPGHERFEFETFRSLLEERGFVLCPTQSNPPGAFRVGTAGHLFPLDFERLTAAIHDVLTAMGVDWAKPAVCTTSSA